ncbi:MAG: hypothetical protein JO027_00630 [Solirubrobacterales bacterium]|nr:hypothetical protein [Solirubrobacterales bacterium]
MRRSIVPTLLLIAASVAAIWALTVPGPAGAAPRIAHFICPQERSHVVPPCCPLPPAGDGNASPAQAVCCQTAQCCTTTPTTCCTTTCCPTAGSPTCCTPTACGPGAPSITSSPWPSKAGQKVVVSGTGTSGAQVALWRKLPGQTSFSQVSTTTADSAGKYTFTLKRGTVMTDQQWYVTSNGAQSATLAQEVEAVLGLASSAHSTVVGRAVVLHGHVTPSHAGERVLIEISRAGTWRVIARPRLTHGSSYSVSHSFATPGAVKLRVVLQSDSRNQRSTSSTLKLTVKS